MNMNMNTNLEAGLDPKQSGTARHGTECTEADLLLWCGLVGAGMAADHCGGEGGGEGCLLLVLPPSISPSPV